MNAPFITDYEHPFVVSPIKTPRRLLVIYGLFGACIGILLGAGIAFTSPAPSFRCAYQVAEATP